MIRFLLFTVIYLVTFICSFGQVTTEDILINNDSIELPGTLSFTKQNEPLVVWIHGSGNVDRNGNQGNVIKANYIKQYRDAMNANDIAFFSYDKRTSNKNNFKHLKDISFEDLVEDAKISIQYLKKNYHFSKIVLVGHSQGSLIGALLANDVDMYISLAGPGETVDKAIVRQVSQSAPHLKLITELHLQELNKTGTIKEVNPMLLSLFRPQNQPFLISWMKYDPIEVFKTIQKPTLIINGTKDSQVTIADAKKLHSSLPTSQLVIIENMNHVLKEIIKDEDNRKSYFSSEFPISKELISTIVTFIKKQ